MIMDSVYLERAANALRRFPTLAARNITPDQFKEYGVEFSEGGSIIIPLYDVFSCLIGIIERTASGSPKYLFDPPNMNVVPYNLGRRALEDRDIVPVFESPFDVMPSPIYSIAVIGLQPSDFGLRLMDSLHSVFVIAFDSDTSGQGASFLLAKRLIARHRHVIVVQGGAPAIYNSLILEKVREVARELRQGPPNLRVL